MSVYNEEGIIAQKIKSLLTTHFPSDKLSFFIGSDNSTDDSNRIIREFANTDSRIFFFPFEERRGKIGVINELAGKVFEHWPMDREHLLLYTDANVILEPDTIPNLTRHFADEKIAVVDANMLNTKLDNKSISVAERTYMDYEILMKHREGLLWGQMIGTFGGCYCLRSTYQVLVPENFIVDEISISLFSALINGGRAINDLEARCYESASHEIAEEYRRKRRISSGNFQNLFHFFSHLWTFRWRTFALWSHKVIRWIGPFLMIICFFSAAALWWLGRDLYGLAC